MKSLSILAAVAALVCASARAETYFYEPPADGALFDIPGGGKVVWIDAVSPTNYTPTLKLVRESWGVAEDVIAHALTNFTFQVVWTNYVSTNRTDVITNAPTDAIPTYLPDTMTGIITNETITAWATTNTIPSLVAVETNSVTAGTTYAAPHDFFFLSPAAPDGARVTVGVEN